ncbi:hypothetical protein D3H55_01345 [Bacillus salacetis]|uniref:Uncharacterized protein n=1 Tax=Bacillus salacetis TaxID=2315464 RepID=A0A3A1RBJ8_9BACI|nr:hypothetical protein D3H55_01345 [Bacillus salacetis]
MHGQRLLSGIVEKSFKEFCYRSVTIQNFKGFKSLLQKRIDLTLPLGLFHRLEFIRSRVLFGFAAFSVWQIGFLLKYEFL